MTHIDEAVVFATLFAVGACLLFAGIIVLAIGVLT